MFQFKMKKVTGISVLLFFLVFVASAERNLNGNDGTETDESSVRAAARDVFSERRVERESRMVNMRGRVGSERLVNNRRIVDSDSRLSNFPERISNILREATDNTRVHQRTFENRRDALASYRTGERQITERRISDRRTLQNRNTEPKTRFERNNLERRQADELRNSDSGRERNTRITEVMVERSRINPETERFLNSERTRNPRTSGNTESRARRSSRNEQTKGLERASQRDVFQNSRNERVQEDRSDNTRDSRSERLNFETHRMSRNSRLTQRSTIAERRNPERSLNLERTRNHRSLESAANAQDSSRRMRVIGFQRTSERGDLRQSDDRMREDKERSERLSETQRSPRTVRHDTPERSSVSERNIPSTERFLNSERSRNLRSLENARGSSRNVRAIGFQRTSDRDDLHRSGDRVREDKVRSERLSEMQRSPRTARNVTPERSNVADGKDQATERFLNSERSRNLRSSENAESNRKGPSRSERISVRNKRSEQERTREERERSRTGADRVSLRNNQERRSSERMEVHERREVRNVDRRDATERRSAVVFSRDEQRDVRHDQREFSGRSRKTAHGVPNAIDENNNKLYASYLSTKHGRLDTAWSKVLTTIAGILIVGQIVHSQLDTKRFYQLKNLLTITKEKIY